LVNVIKTKSAPPPRGFVAVAAAVRRRRRRPHGVLLDVEAVHNSGRVVRCQHLGAAPVHGDPGDVGAARAQAPRAEPEAESG